MCTRGLGEACSLVGSLAHVLATPSQAAQCPTYTLELEMESPHGVQRSDTRAGIKPESS